MKNLERFMKALANRRRIEIVRFLYSKKKATVGEVSGHIKLSFKSTSRHINILKAAEIIDGDQVGLSIYYYLNDTSNPVIRHIIG
ncbi:MAG: metalloregulator ArsR/SmtB family transcription factor [bacterium]